MNSIAVLMTALLVGGGDPGDTDLEKLQGTWLLVKMEREGQEIAAEEFKDARSIYEKNRLTLMDGDHVRRRGIITLNPSRKPKAMNTWDQDGPYEDQTVPGIYEIEGETLKLCFARPGEERPKEFTTKSGTGILCCIYKKQKR